MTESEGPGEPDADDEGGKLPLGDLQNRQLIQRQFRRWRSRYGLSACQVLPPQVTVKCYHFHRYRLAGTPSCSESCDY